MKVALVYDRVNKWGGAERVLLLLHEIFPEAPLFTSVYNKDTASWAKVFHVKSSFLQSFPFAKNAHELYAILMPLAFESFLFDEYDLVISLTSEAAKGIVTKPETKHICICLTPTRYLWSGYNEYFKNFLFRILAIPVLAYLRVWDKIASLRPDAYIAISQEVQKRIKIYYGRESQVIYPPVSSLSFEKNKKQYLSSADSNGKEDFNKGYFLVVSRLIPIKRIDIAIKACNRLQLPLKIIGSGTDEKRLQRMAGSTVSFLGNLTDNELVRYYTGCCALLFPGVEDFGLTVLEAQSFGKPVIGYEAGGALETIIKGKTGEFFYPQNEKALADTIARLLENGKLSLKSQRQQYYQKNCINQAKKFAKKQFKKHMREYIDQIMKEKNL